MFKTILLKELKDVIRDKRSLTLLILVPLLMMTALVFFYDKMLSNDDDKTFTIAVHETVDAEFITELQNVLSEVDFLETNDIHKELEEKNAQVGLMAEAGWRDVLAKKKSMPIEILYDSGSQASSQAFSIVTSALSNWETAIIQKRIKDEAINQELVHVFDINERSINEEGQAIASFMLAIILPLIIPIAIAQGSYPAATELFAGEKEKKTMEALLITPAKPMPILLGKWMAISLLGIFTGLLSAFVFVIEMQWTTNLKAGFSMLNNPVQFFILSLVLITLFALFISAIEMIFSMLANTVKEAGYYLGPIFGLLSLPMIFMFFLNESLNIWLYPIPVLNLFLFVRDTFSDQFTLTAFFVACISYIMIIYILFLIAKNMFQNHRIMLGK